MNAIPPYINADDPDPAIDPSISRWRQFILETQSRRNDDPPSANINQVDLPEMLEPTISNSTWKPKQRTRLERAQFTLLRSAWIPLLLRSIVFLFCLAALGFGAAVSAMSGDSRCRDDTGATVDNRATSISPIMAMVIDSTAILYLLFMIWDEYTRPPLGLRSAKAKVLILLLDLMFIVFSSVNATLAFDAISAYDGCKETANIVSSQWKQKALASSLLVALFAWLLTFAVSILRIIEKIQGMDA